VEDEKIEGLVDQYMSLGRLLIIEGPEKWWWCWRQEALSEVENNRSSPLLGRNTHERSAPTVNVHTTFDPITSCLNNAVTLRKLTAFLLHNQNSVARDSPIVPLVRDTHAPPENFSHPTPPPELSRMIRSMILYRSTLSFVFTI
jgi:hypothetical protein